MTDPGGSKFRGLQGPLGNTEWRKPGESLCPLVGNKWLATQLKPTVATNYCMHYQLFWSFKKKLEIQVFMKNLLSFIY